MADIPRKAITLCSNALIVNNNQEVSVTFPDTFYIPARATLQRFKIWNNVQIRDKSKLRNSGSMNWSKPDETINDNSQNLFYTDTSGLIGWTNNPSSPKKPSFKVTNKSGSNFDGLLIYVTFDISIPPVTQGSYIKAEDRILFDERFNSKNNNSDYKAAAGKKIQDAYSSYFPKGTQIRANNLGSNPVTIFGVNNVYGLT